MTSVERLLLVVCSLSDGDFAGVADPRSPRWAQTKRIGDRWVVEDSVNLSIDAVNDSDEARRTWRVAAAGNDSRIDFVHLVISDALEHEWRVNHRDRGLAHVGEPTWADVQHRRANFAA